MNKIRVLPICAIFLQLLLVIAAVLFMAGCPNPPDTDNVTTHAVIVMLSGEASGESVTADVYEAAEGTTVTLTAALGSGRQVTLSAEGVTITPSTISTNGGTAAFNMQATAVGILATFSDTYAITVTPGGAVSGESVTASVSEAAEGTTVTLTAVLGSGRKVALSAEGVTITPSTISTDGGTAAFTMPATAVEVTAAFSYSIGSTGPAGGFVFYDKGSYSDGWRYLEAAPSDLSSMAWSNVTDELVGGTSQEIGTGKANTDLITAQAGHTDSAAQACLDYGNGTSYDDWFLPSQDELDLMHDNLHANGLGGFASSGYWSSSEYEYASGSASVLFQHFNNGTQGIYSKDTNNRVRPCRAF